MGFAVSAEATIDSLVISIDASASGASKGIDEFIGSLTKMKSAADGSVTQLGKLKSALDGFKSNQVSGTTAKNLNSIVEAANKLNGSNNIAGLKSALDGMGKNMVSKTTGTNLASLVAAANSLDENAAEKVGELANGVQRLNGAKVSRSLGTNLSNIAAAAGKSSGIEKLASGAKSASDQTNGLISRLARLGETLSHLGSLVVPIEAISRAIASCVDASNEYIEDMNLATTVLGSYADQAKELAASYQEIFGIDSGAFLRNMGTFDSMAKGMGVASDAAYTMSKNLAQLGYDLASYYNISNDSAMEKVRAGLAGEIEPLRALGFDLTTARLQQEAYNLGLNESVSSMTQAQKAMLRYQAIMNQVSWSHGDLAKTIASPSNMLRVFQQNVTIAARSIGNIFLPMMQAILPVAIAVAKVLATVGNMIADLTGGTQIANTEFGSGGLDTDDSLGGVADAADDAASGLGDAGDAADSTGNKASDAAGKVKELKRQLMGFDEINKFSSTSDSSGSGSSPSGSGGNGGSGGGGGGGNGGSGSLALDNYDWIGDGLDDSLYNELLDFLGRLYDAIKPLAEAFSVAFTAIKSQFEGLDMAGAVKNAIAGVVNLISNAVRNIIEILTPLAVAFNFPETIALAFDLAAQMCITLSSAINGVGSMVKGFTDTALVPLVAWIGDKVRGAIKVCISVLASWGQWFRDNTPVLNNLGQVAGTAAGLILRLAAAVSDVAFGVAADVFLLLSDMVQTLCTVLVNSGAAKVAAAALGAALAFTGIVTAIEGVTVAFGYMAGIIVKDSDTGVTGIRTLGDETQTLGDKFSLVTGYISNWSNGLYNGAKEAASAEAQQKKLNAATETSIDKLTAANDAVGKQAESYKKAKAQSDTYGGSVNKMVTYVESVKLKHTQAKASVAEFNVEINRSKERLNNNKNALSQAVQQTGKFSTETKSAAKELVTEAKNLASSTAAKTKASVASTALAVQEGVAATATGLLSLAMDAIPGMALVAVLGLAVSAFESLVGIVGEAILNFLNLSDNPVLSFLGDLANSLLGVDDATGDVTETTEEANQVLSDEQQQINDNIDSINEYEKSHDNLALALETSRMSEEQLAAYLQQTGKTLEDVTGVADDYVDTMINGFEEISTSGQISSDELFANLQSNYQTMQTWSANLQLLMEKTGLDSSNALVQELISGGPEKYATALQEIVNGGKTKYDEFKRQAEQYGDAWATSLSNEITGGRDQYTVAVGNVATDVTNAMRGNSSTVTSTAGDIASETADEYGSHTEEASASGREMTQGFADGVGSEDMVELARSKAAAVCTAAVEAFNGGNGYQLALDAGRNMTGGYGDGIAAASADAVNKAKAVMTKVVNGYNGGSGYNKAKSAGSEVGKGYTNGIEAQSNAAVTAARNTCQKVVDAFKSKTTNATSAGSSIMTSFKNGLSNNASGAVNAAKNVSSQVSNALKNAASTARGSGASIGEKFVNGINSYKSSAKSAGSSLVYNFYLGVESGYNGAVQDGRYIASGFSSGIAAYNNSVYWRGYNLAAYAIKGIRDRAAIGSPSKVTHQFGIWLDEGLANGIEDATKTVTGAAEKMTAKALDASSTASKIGREVGSAFGSGVASGVDAKQVASALAYASESTAAANSVNWSGGGAVSSHGSGTVSVDDSSVMGTLASAVMSGLMSFQVSGAGSNAGSQSRSEIVLKVDSQTLARAVMSGQDALARRGVLSFT